jgi:hypothetical protein
VSASDATSRESVFWRIPNRWRKSGERTAEWWIEIDAEGYIPREIELDDERRALSVTRLEEYGLWNDSAIARTPPGTPEFDRLWGDLGGEISREEFEATYARAAAQLRVNAAGSGCALSIVVIVVCGAVLVLDPFATSSADA